MVKETVEYYYQPEIILRCCQVNCKSVIFWKITHKPTAWHTQENDDDGHFGMLQFVVK